jgi:hypothetical protein
MTKWSEWKKGVWSMSLCSLFAALPHETRLPNECISYRISVLLSLRLHEQCHFRFLSHLTDFARLSIWFWDRNFPISPSDFVQRDVHQSDAYKNQTDNLAKLVGQQKSDWFWLFRGKRGVSVTKKKKVLLNIFLVPILIKTERQFFFHSIQSSIPHQGPLL